LKEPQAPSAPPTPPERLNPWQEFQRSHAPRVLVFGRVTERKC
jgi:hypothetical protein